MKLNSYVFAVLAFMVLGGISAQAADYCMAVRGNGELEPAHWGGVAKVIEKLGLPKGMAGGSSASITMMLVDGIATNEYVKSATGPEQAARAALLIKSLEGFLGGLTATPEWKDFSTLYKTVQELKSPKWAELLKQSLGSDPNLAMGSDPNISLAQARDLVTQNFALLKRNFSVGVKLGLISQTSYAPLFESAQRLILQNSLPANEIDANAYLLDYKIARFYAGELYQAVTVFGAFNAQTDNTLFFRPGIVNFDRLADQFGRIADFYSMQNLVITGKDNERALWNQFVKTCSGPSMGITWDTLVAEYPQCLGMLTQLMKVHFSDGVQHNFATQMAGVSIGAFPSTAVLVGDCKSPSGACGHADALRGEAQYLENTDHPELSMAFTVNNVRDVRFGYWGRTEYLRQIEREFGQNGLYRDDEKTSRFKALGPATWKTVLGLSPAEPGLSPLKTFTNNGEEMTSAGGWSDLHPILLLRAAGCKNVVYITRRGGESLFGQGVAKRLLGLDRDWSKISTSSAVAKKASAKLNNNGDPTADPKSTWSRLYNLANPNSSFKRALRAADAVLCTSWDNFEITQGVQGMIEDAYSSPFYIPLNSGLRGENLTPVLNPKDFDQENGYPTYAGCF